MTQPKIVGVGHGVPRMLYGSDGSNWYAILVDSDGHVKIDVVTLPLPTDAAKETKQDTMITALQLIDDLRNALGSVNTDDLQVDVKTLPLPTDAATETTLLLIKGYVDALETLLAGGLPAALDSGALKIKEQSPLTGFATSANQTTMITALQLIDDLRAALGSVDTDDLQVDVKTYPGSNALGNFPFGYYDRYAESASVAGTGGEVFANGTVVPAGEVWVISQVVVFHSDATARACNAQDLVNAVAYELAASLSLATWVLLEKSGAWVLKAGDRMRGRFVNLDVGDTGYAQFLGYKMKVA